MIDPKIDFENMEITFSAASADPYRRYDGGLSYFECLEISEDAIDMSRLNGGASILKNHDPDHVLGTVVRAWIEDGTLAVRARFRKNDPESVSIFHDAADGTLKNVSIGYRQDVVKNSGSAADGTPIVDVTRWTVYEVSVAVGVPADPSVGFYRSININQNKDFKKMDDPEKVIQPADEQQEPKPQECEKECEPCECQAQEETEKKEDTTPPEDDPQAPAAGVPDVEPDQPAAAPPPSPEEQRCLRMRAAAPAIMKSLNVIKTRKDTIMSTERNYSLARALQSLVNNTVEASIEREESARMMSELGLHSRDNSIMVRSGFDGTSGAGLIGQEHRGDQFVEILRTRMGVKGARVLAGLTGVGTVDIPTQTGVTTIGIGAVGGTSADQNPNVGSVTLTPKKFSAAVTVSEELLAEGNPDAIAIVMNDLEAQIARKLDVTILKGNADPEIKGIDGTTGVQTHLITSFDNIAWSDVTAMYGKIADYEIEEGDLAWIGKGSTKALLMGKSRDVGSGRFLLEDGQMLGYGFNVCGALAADELYLGAWKNVIIGQWGGLQLKVDDITGIKSGSVTIVGKLLADVAIVNAAAFVKRVASQAS